LRIVDDVGFNETRPIINHLMQTTRFQRGIVM